MTRLQGLLLVAAGMILIFSCHSGSAIRKSVTAFLWASPSALMLGWWLASNHSATGRFRPIGEHPLGYFQNASSLGLSTFAALVPIIGQSHLAHAGLVPRFGGILLIYLPLLAALGALIRLHWVHKRASGLGILGAMLATYALIDLIGLPILASIVRVDQMHYRFLYPALTCALISVGLIYVQSPRPAWMRIGLLCAALCWSAWGLIYVHYYSKGWSF